MSRQPGEIVVAPGWRLNVSPSSEHFADGSVGARLTLERIEPRLREVEPTGNPFHITGRGKVWPTIQPEQPYEVNEHVLIRGAEHVVTGIEAYATMHGRDPGQQIGLLVRPIPTTEAEREREVTRLSGGEHAERRRQIIERGGRA